MSRARALAHHAGTAGRRVYHRAVSDFGFKSVDRIIVYGGILLVGVIVYKLWKVKDKIGKGIDSAEQAVANAYVKATSDPPVQIADGITYQLPNGSRIAAKLTTPVGGGDFTYLGKRYKLVAASPPGSGNYLAKQV